MFNATGFDSLQAVVSAAEELNQPVSIAHAEVHNVFNDIAMVGPVMVAMAQNAKVPVCVHLDHGTSLDMVYKALRLGFTSVMMDASALPYAENLRLTKMITEMAHSMNVSVEAELGRLVTGEAGSGEEMVGAKAEDFYTRPDEAEAFCKETGIDALAIAFGTAHGFYSAQPKLDFDVVASCAKATAPAISLAPIFTQVASAAMPPLPGSAKISVTSGFSLSFLMMACSRPPPPITISFMIVPRAAGRLV
jgi:fructose-bisphosphate aldolase class II